MSYVLTHKTIVENEPLTASEHNHITIIDILYNKFEFKTYYIVYLFE